MEVKGMVKKIMVVDDDPGVIYTIKHGIENLDSNYEIITVNSGKKCLELLENNSIPDLILLDIMMPDISGWETYNKIREKIPSEKLPIVFLTARTDRIAKDAGGFLAEDYIEKPFRVPELKERIDKILSSN
jgi:two-component system response regulator VicR